MAEGGLDALLQLQVGRSRHPGGAVRLTRGRAVDRPRRGYPSSPSAAPGPTQQGLHSVASHGKVGHVHGSSCQKRLSFPSFVGCSTQNVLSCKLMLWIHPHLIHMSQEACQDFRVGKIQRVFGKNVPFSWVKTAVQTVQGHIRSDDDS